MTDQASQKSFLQKLWDRRFFQYLATYVGVSWGLIQFTEWLVNRYDLYSSWVDYIAIFLFAVLPAMISFIYIHGAPGHDEWKPFEKIFYPINLVFALAASFFIFDGNARDTSRQIEVTNELGDTITRVVPKQEFTSRIVFFPLESDFGSDKDWMEYGIPILTDLDLEQDMKWFSIRPTSLKEEYQDYGHKIGDDIPFASKLQIANDVYCDFFSTGNLSFIDNSYSLDIEIYNSKNGKSEYKTSLQSENIYELVDQVSSSIRENINNFKIENQETTIDLPSSDLVSNNEEAFKLFVQAILMNNQGISGMPQALEFITQAIESDPNCAECFSILAQVNSALSQDSKDAITSAIEKGLNLPERQKLHFSFYNYLYFQDIDKALKLLDMWTDLYPMDIFPYRQLAALYQRSYNFVKAEEVLEKAIKNGHYNTMLLNAANLNLTMKDYEEAEKYINQYKALYPKRAKKKTLLADIYSAKGEFTKALEILEEHNIINPNDYTNYLKIAKLRYQLNEKKESAKAYATSLAKAKTARDSLSVYENEFQFYGRFGMIDQAVNVMQKHEELFFNNFPKAAYIQAYLQFGSIYTKVADSDDKIEEIVAKVKAVTPEYSMNILEPILAYLEALWYNDKEAYEQAYETAKPMLSSSGESGIALSEAIKFYFREDWENAIIEFLKFEELSGVSSLDQSDSIIESYIGAGKFKEGMEYINDRLKTDKYHPLGLLSKLTLLKVQNKTKGLKEIVDQLDKLYAETPITWEDKAKFEALKEELNL